MDATTRIEQIITPSVEAMGYEVVRVQLIGNERPVLQIMAERADRAAMVRQWWAIAPVIQDHSRRTPSEDQRQHNGHGYR